MNRHVILESQREQQRRGWVETQERLRDAGESFALQKVSAIPEDWNSSKADFAARPSEHRLKNAAGRHSLGVGIATRQIMWARWLEIAVANELEAREEYQALLNRHQSEPLLREFKSSLVCINALVSVFEALYGEIKYLIPPAAGEQPSQRTISLALKVAFGPAYHEWRRFAGEVNWLFVLRDLGVRPHSKTGDPAFHPAGLSTGPEHIHFNAVTSGRAVDAAMQALAWAESPVRPHNNWIKRWSADRANQFRSIVRPLASARAAAELPTKQLSYRSLNA